MFVARIVDEDSRHAVHHGKRRITRMVGQQNVGLFGDRQNGLGEVSVIRPDVIDGVLSVKHLFFDLLTKIDHAELASRIASRVSIILVVQVLPGWKSICDVGILSRPQSRRKVLNLSMSSSLPG